MLVRLAMSLVLVVTWESSAPRAAGVLTFALLLVRALPPDDTVGNGTQCAVGAGFDLPASKLKA